MFEENLKKSEGETKTSDASSNETQVDNVKVSGETQTDSKPVGENCFDVFKPEHKETNKVEDEMSETYSKYMDDCKVIIEAMSDADATNFQRNKCVRMLESIASDKSVFPETLVDEFMLAKKTTCYHIRNWACNMQKRVKDSDADTLTHIDHHVKTLIKTIGNAEHLRVESSFADCTNLLKTLSVSINDHIDNLSTGENQTAEKPLTYTMAEKVAEAVTAGDEIQAPVAATEGSSETQIDPETQATLDDAKEIHRIIGAIDNRTEPWKNDMKFIVRCLGGSASRVKVELLSEYQAADLENAAIVLMRMLEMCFEHEDASADKVESLLAAEARCQELFNEFVASGIANLVGERYHDSKFKSLSKSYADALSRLQKKRITLTETAATQEPEEPAGLPVDITSEMDELGAKLKEAGNLIKAEKWSDAKEFYKSQLTPYLADENLSADLRDQISAISTKATNMLAGQKQLERKKEAEAKKSGNRKSGKKARRSKR